MGALFSYPSVIAFTGMSILNAAIPHTMIIAFKAHSQPGRDQNTFRFITSLHKQTVDYSMMHPEWCVMFLAQAAGFAVLTAYGVVVKEPAIYNTAPIPIVACMIGSLAYTWGWMRAKHITRSAIVSPDISGDV